MVRTSISELKARLSAFLDIVRQGGDILITDRGRPIARLVPVEGDRRQESRCDLLLRSGQLKSPTAALPSEFWKRRRPSDAEGRSVDVVLEERGKGW